MLIKLEYKWRLLILYEVYLNKMNSFHMNCDLLYFVERGMLYIYRLSYLHWKPVEWEIESNFEQLF